MKKLLIISLTLLLTSCINTDNLPYLKIQEGLEIYIIQDEVYYFQDTRTHICFSHFIGETTCVPCTEEVLNLIENGDNK